MKKVFLSLGIFLTGTCAALAQDKHDHSKHDHAATPVKVATAPAPAAATAPAAAPKATSLKPENLKFTTETHDFGTLPEGPAAEYEFKFTNTGKEPIIIQNVSASCGCTTPSWTKEPVLPGKTGTIKASYATAGRPNQFTKSITVMSNAGTKVLTIKGDVEKAPESSVPQNSSMIKTN